MKEKPPAGPCARQELAGRLGVAFGDVMAWVAWTRPVASEDESHVLGCREHPCRVCSVVDELGLEVGIRSCPLLKPTERVESLVGNVWHFDPPKLGIDAEAHAGRGSGALAFVGLPDGVATKVREVAGAPRCGTNPHGCVLRPCVAFGVIGESKTGRVCHARTIPRWHVCSPCSLLVRLPFRLGYM